MKLIHNRLVHTVVLAVAALGTDAAGAQNLSSSGYVGSQLRTGGRALMATVVNVRVVDSDKSATASSNMIATGIGALVGGLLGNHVGGGSGRVATTAVGAVAGGVAGNAVQAAMNALTQTKSQEVVVKLDDGELTVVTQELDTYSAAIVKDQRVLLVSNSGVLRVVPMMAQ